MNIFFCGGGGGITKLDWFYGSFLCILGSFLNVSVQNEDIGVAKISNIVLSMPDIPDIFGG